MINMNNEQILFVIASIIVALFLIISFFVGLKIGEKKYLKKQNFKPINIEETPTNNYVREVDRYIDGLTIELPKNYEDIIYSWCNGEFSAKTAAEKLHISTTTLYKRFGHMKRSNVTK